MLLSTQTDYLEKHFGMEKAVKILSQAGFDALDLTMAQARTGFHPLLCGDLEENAALLRSLAAQNGVVFNQAHAPFPTSKTGDPVFNNAVHDAVLRAIRLAGLIGVKTVIVHPMQDLYYIENKAATKAINLEFYRSLAPAAKEAGVRICIENMWQRSRSHQQIIASACATPRDFTEMLDTLADDVFTACLDLGHCILVGESPAAMIRALGPRLGALHVHDNCSLDDDHTLPYLGTIHWDDVYEALAEVGYAGDFTFEADDFYMKFDPELAPDCARFLCAVGRRMIRGIEAAKKAL